MPVGSHTWSISARSSLRTSGLKVTGPATPVAICFHPAGPPAQSVATSTLYRLGAMRRARRAEKSPGAALVWRWPFSWATITSRPSKRVSWTVTSPGGSVPMAVPP